MNEHNIFPLPRPSMVDDSPEALRAERRQRAEQALAVRGAFAKARQEIRDLAQMCAKLPDLDRLSQAHATAIADLAGLKLHRIDFNIADAEDALAARDDLEALPRVVDPLIRALGQQLADAFPYIDKNQFEDVLLRAIEGNCSFEATKAAEAFEP